MKNEQWRTIKGFTAYEVSNFGRVRSWQMRNCNTVRILNPSPNKKGYLRINLYSNKKIKSEFVATLVLEAFGSKRPRGLQCAHNDGNKLNNHISNLRWATTKENAHDKILHKTILSGEKHWAAKLTWDDVEYIRKNYKKYRYGKTNRRELQTMFGVSATTILEILRGEIWKKEDTK